MPEYLAPGVYVEEISIGSKPIEGASTSTAGFVGVTERGPAGARLVTSAAEYRRVYGGTLPDSHLSESVAGFFTNGGRRCYVARVAGSGSRTAGLLVAAGGSGTAPRRTKKKEADTEGEGAQPEETPLREGGSVQVEALGPGAWGDRVAVCFGPASVEDPSLFNMKVAYWAGERPPAPIVDPASLELRRDSNRREPALLEEYDNLCLNPQAHNSCERRVNAASALVRIKVSASDGLSPSGRWQLLEGGSDSSVGLDDYRGVDVVGSRTGLAALAEHDISIVCAPSHNDVRGLDHALVEQHCERLKDRFAILAAPAGSIPTDLRPALDSSYAAFYYPWVRVVGPGGSLRSIPPVGHLAGVYARTDIGRGVFKAPANATIRGVQELDVVITRADQEVLNPRRVNCLRSFPSRGLRVWGARTTSSDPELKYINVRRLLIFLSKSIEDSTQWVVFEPNDHRLWARVRQSVNEFLVGVWRNGALMGRQAEEAFFVRCDKTTMTQDDIDNGRLIVLIGVAPVRPAEFVVFRIAQWKPGNE